MNNKNIFFSPWAYLITNCILKHLTQFTADQLGSAQLANAFTTHQLGMNYYVNFLGGLGSNEFQLK